MVMQSQGRVNNGRWWPGGRGQGRTTMGSGDDAANGTNGGGAAGGAGDGRGAGAPDGSGAAAGGPHGAGPGGNGAAGAGGSGGGAGGAAGAGQASARLLRLFEAHRLTPTQRRIAHCLVRKAEEAPFLSSVEVAE